MRQRRLITALAVCTLTAFTVVATDASAQPFADGPDGAKEKVAPKPKQRAWTVKNGKYAFTFEFTPGIAEANKVAEIQVFATSIPKTPHPRYGNRIPLAGAQITVEATTPAGESVGRFRAHPLRLQAGRFAFHITPGQDGLYELLLQGKTAKGEELEARVKMPVGIWPLPKELEGSGDDVGGGPRRRRPIIFKKN